MTTKKSSTETKVRNVYLPVAVDAALVSAAKAEGRSTRAHIAHLLAVCVGLACLALAGCSGAPESPVDVVEVIPVGDASTDAIVYCGSTGCSADYQPGDGYCTDRGATCYATMDAALASSHHD